MKNRFNSCLLLPALLAAAFSATTCAANITVAETVSGLDGPWTYVNGGLNTAYQYGVGDEAPPLVVNASTGISFAPGSKISIQYVSGLESANSPYFPYVTAAGDLNVPVNNGVGYSGRVDPSAFFNPATYPAYLSELVGTFANSAGAIVGTPFAIGDALTVTVPTGATSLDLGVNDDIYHENSGAFLVDVTGSAAASPLVTPEPATVGLLIAGVALIWAVRQWQA